MHTMLGFGTPDLELERCKGACHLSLKTDAGAVKVGAASQASSYEASSAHDKHVNQGSQSRKECRQSIEAVNQDLR